MTTAQPPVSPRAERVAGCLFGLAGGDAWGLPTEFVPSVAEILDRWPPDGPEIPRHENPIRVTDDTQMALAVGEALVTAMNSGKLSPGTLAIAFTDAFVRWAESPDNYRAPGITCMSACWALKANSPWLNAGAIRSKGCGANMRVAPVALVPDEIAENRAAIAQFQAAGTHAHPTALAAADLTAFAIADLLAGAPLIELPARMRDYAPANRSTYYRDWLGPLWRRAGASSETDYIARGWGECLAALDRLDAALKSPDPTADPCRITGAGKVAEEALATAVYALCLFPGDPISALRRVVISGGDSDSIACIAGALAGAHYGISAWPAEWRIHMEYRERIEKLIAAFVGASNSSGGGDGIR